MNFLVNLLSSSLRGGDPSPPVGGSGQAPQSRLIWARLLRSPPAGGSLAMTMIGKLTLLINNETILLSLASGARETTGGLLTKGG